MGRNKRSPKESRVLVRELMLDKSTESWETANSQHPVTSNYVALCRSQSSASSRRFRASKRRKAGRRGGEGKREKKRKGKEKEEKGREGRKIRFVALEDWLNEEGGRACVRPRMGQLFDAPLNKGSIHFVTHVTHNGRDRGNLYGSKNNPRRFLTRKKKRLRFNSRGILIVMVSLKLLINFK